MTHTTCPQDLPSGTAERTFDSQELTARVALRLLNPALDPDGSLIRALADANKALAASGNDHAIREALGRQAGLLEMVLTGFLNRASTAPDSASSEALGRLALRASEAHLKTLGALHQMNLDAA